MSNLIKIGNLLVKPGDSLLLGERVWVFNLIGEEVVNLLEAEVLAVVIGL